MKYYFIYSAGGGAGDWNGVKRVFKSSMPDNIQSNILLKFGDIFLSHASVRQPICSRRWNNITNLRDWLFEATDDRRVYNSNILLDSGTAKLVSWINFHNPTMTCPQLVEEFDRLVNTYNILDKYISIVADSNISSAVTFDIPNPFKIRSQSSNTRLNILDDDSNDILIAASAKYSNKIYNGLKAKIGNRVDSVLRTIINGTWTADEIADYLGRLDYTPKHIAIGGLSSVHEGEFATYMPTLISALGNNYDSIHFLGCGGLRKVKILKDKGFNASENSVDCSTVINRTIDGNVSGTSQSCYYVYSTCEQIRIKPETKEDILAKHRSADTPLFSFEQITEIINKVLEHQNNNSSSDTYNARAKLLIHNTDVFRRNAL